MTDTASDASWDAMILVGRVARTHGLKGHVVVHPETDFVEIRFAPGSRLWTRGGHAAAGAAAGAADGALRALVVADSRLQGPKPVVGFEGIASIEAAETLAGCELRIPEAEAVRLDGGQVYEHELVGCTVEQLVDGVPTAVGRVVKVEGGLGGSRLIVEAPGGEVQVPFATAICVEVDVAGRRIRIDPPEGLLDLNAPAPPRERTRRAPRKPWRR